MRNKSSMLTSLYEVYNNYKFLYNFYVERALCKSREEIEKRIQYLERNKEIKQRTELETLRWLLYEKEQ